MPNHCYQQVNVQGPSYLIDELYASLIAEADPKFCQLILPMPFEVNAWKKVKVSSSIGPLYQTDVPAWYDWRVNNWGTKWDVCDVQITNPIEHNEDGTSTFGFNCWTAWSPPVPVWKKLVELGIDVHADYQDEGMMFEGEFVNGEDRCWEPEEVIDEEDA